MLTAYFRSFTGERVHMIESAYFGCVQALLKNADGQDVASQKAGVWHRDGGVYVAIAFESRVLIRFEHPVTHDHQEFGPCAGLQLIDGAMWTSDDSPICLARFDDAQQAWHLQTRPAPAMPRCILSRARWV